MPVLLYVVYPYMLWSAWYEAVTGHSGQRQQA